MSDAAVAAALWLAGKDPADFGLTLLERYRVRCPQAPYLTAVDVYGMIDFSDDDSAQRYYLDNRPMPAEVASRTTFLISLQLSRW